MKAIAKFLTVVTLIVLLAGGYIYWAAALQVLPESGLVESAADRVQVFDNIVSTARVGSSDLIVYSDASGSAEQYSFVTYTLRLRNMNALPAEWLQLDITPQQGDVLLVKASTEDVPAFSEKLLTVVLLTDRSAASYARSATLTYYVYGHEFSIPVQLTI